MYCDQRTDDLSDDLPALLARSDSLAARLAGRLGLQPDWAERWQTLSHGERKRSQIACALWREPNVLAIDEPTNHVDSATRRLLMNALRQYRGIGLLVSHDRELLDEICNSCVVFESGRIVHRPGGYSQAMEDARREVEDLKRRKANAVQAMKALVSTASDRRREASAADARRSRRHIAPGDNDARGRINLARLTNKDAIAGRQLRQLQGRVEQATERAESLHLPKQPRLSIDLLGEPARQGVVLRMDEQAIELSSARSLVVPRLQVTADDRIGITGPNGAGKSTLVRHLLVACTLPADRLVYVPQEIGAAEGARILAEVKHLDPKRLGAVMSVVASLGSEPSRVLTTDTPSPGELRKLLLGLGLSRRPHLVVMDEPTNHLDVPSVECLEAALSDCRCAVVLVSHDERLLKRVVRTRWAVERGIVTCREMSGTD